MVDGPRRELRLLALLPEGASAALEALVTEINTDPEYEYTLRLAAESTAAGILARVSQGAPDVILVRIGAATGLEQLEALKPALAQTAVVALAEPREMDLVRAAMRTGVHDYLLTPRLDADRLVRCLRYCLLRYGMDLTLRGAAFVDDLTGLYNKRGFLRIADHQIRLSKRKGRGFTLAFVEVTGLAEINAVHGRPEGDAAIKAAAEILRASFRDSDVLGRMEGDELCALAIETDDEDEAPLRDRLRAGMDTYNTRTSRPYQLRMRVVVLHEEYDSPTPLDGLLAGGRRELYAQPTA